MTALDGEHTLQGRAVSRLQLFLGYGHFVFSECALRFEGLGGGVVTEQLFGNVLTLAVKLELWSLDPLGLHL